MFRHPLSLVVISSVGNHSKSVQQHSRSNCLARCNLLFLVEPTCSIPWLNQPVKLPVKTLKDRNPPVSTNTFFQSTSTALQQESIGSGSFYIDPIQFGLKSVTAPFSPIFDIAIEFKTILGIVQ